MRLSRGGDNEGGYLWFNEASTQASGMKDKSRDTVLLRKIRINRFEPEDASKLNVQLGTVYYQITIRSHYIRQRQRQHLSSRR